MEGTFNGSNYRDENSCEFCGNDIEICMCVCPYCGERDSCECCLHDAATGGG